MSSSSRQTQTQNTATTNNDNRVAVGDQGVLAGNGANVGNDNRTFDDHSSFSITSDSSVRNSNSGNDNRSFDDHSSFFVDGSNRSVTTTTTTDNRDFSDRSTFNSTDNRVTNITTADPAVAAAAARASEQSALASGRAAEASNETARAIAALALGSADRLAGAGTELFDAALAYGDSVGERSAGTTRDAFQFAGQAGEGALGFISGAFDKAVDAVTKSAKEDRDFAGAFVGKVFETTKSADQQNTEKIVKAATVLGVAAAVIFGAVKIFGGKN